MRWWPALTFLTAVCLCSGPLRAQVKPADQVLPAKKITMQLTDAAGQDAVTQLAKQSGIDIKVAESLAGKKVSLNSQQVPFWQALDEIAGQVGGSVSLYQTGADVGLVPGKPLVVAPSYHGIFRGAVSRVGVTSDFDADQRQFQLQLLFAWEPWYRPFFLEVKSYKAVFAVDAKGQAHTVADKNLGKYPVASQHAFPVDLKMAAPARSCPTLQSLTGELRILGPVKMLTVNFTDLKPGSQPQKRVIDDIVITLQSVKGAPGQNWVVAMDLAYPDGGPELESFQQQSWLVHNRIKLQSRKNPKLTHEAKFAEYKRVTSNQATIHYLFKGDKNQPIGAAEDWELVYITPGRIVEVAVPFAFKDIPLP